MTKVQDINFAIPETKRPPIYTSMKYWGKKPHNVWHEYIKNYTPKNGVFLDPFAGSGMSGIEAVRAGRKAICLDINPLTTFIFDVYCSDFNALKFEKEAEAIYLKVLNNEWYQNHYLYEEGYILHNSKYKKVHCYEVCFSSLDGKKRFERIPNELDVQKDMDSKQGAIQTPYPNKTFRDSTAFSLTFRKSVGEHYSDLFTHKNLIVLSLIFDEILKVKEESVKKQLLFGFIQSVHLCTRMCVPRSKKTKRDYSTSWGRSAYFIASTEMEMNPLLVFKNNCIGKQSVSSCLSYLKKYVGAIKGKNITFDSKIDTNEDYNLWYGIKDSKRLSSLVAKGGVDFVITDPPYGGLVPYLDLSYIWLAWLELVNPIYNPNYSEEISINNTKQIVDFREDMAKVLSELSVVLKDNSKIVLTFNNKDAQVWKALLGSILDSGHTVEKVLHQQNLRSGESNVKDKYGTSSSDFYIRCVKSDTTYEEIPITDVHEFILEQAKTIILERGEPTPYQILFNGILTKLSSFPIVFQNFDDDLVVALKSTNQFEVVQNNDSLAGNYWWIKDMDINLDNPKSLTSQVKQLITTLFEKNENISHEKLLSEVYKKFPNGLSPDAVMLEKTIKEIAERKGVIWQRKKKN